MDSSKTCRLSGSLVVCALAVSLVAQAQPEPIADLALSITPSLSQVLVPGSSGTLQVTVLNNGPDDAGLTSPASHPIVVRTSLQMERPDGGIDVRFLPASSPDSCVLIATVIDPPPGMRPQWSYGLSFPPTRSGESTTCQVRFTLDPRVSGQQVPITWRVRTFSEIDPNPANDSVSLIFNVGGVPTPQQVPILHPVGLFVLLLVMLGVAGWLHGPRRR